MVFRTLEGEPVVPSWLRRNSQRVLPAPFFQGEPEREEPPEDGEPDPFPNRAPGRESLAPQQRASMPAPQQRASLPAPQQRASLPAPQQRQSIVPQPREPLVPPPGRDPMTPPRRSSLPPRVSMPPPPVVITRPPPMPNTDVPPPPEPPPPLTPEEQEAFALAALELASLRARTLMNVESEVLELAVAIASSIIEREVKLDPSLYEQLARSAVAVLGDTSHAKLRVSRAAHRAISEIHGEPAVDVDGVRVELTLDNSLEGLSVIAESGASRVDGRVSERLAAVMRAMEAEHRQVGDGE